MSNEQEWREIMAQRAKERERALLEEQRQVNESYLEFHSCHAEVRLDCACTCGKCGCCS